MATDRLEEFVVEPEEYQAERPELRLVAPIDPVKKKNNEKQRIAAWKEILAIRDPRKAAERGFQAWYDAVDYLRQYLGREHFGQPTILSEDSAAGLMGECLAIKTSRELTTARYEMIRKYVFDDITKRYEKQGADDADAISGVLEVPSLGKKFCKEGAGPGEVEIDWDMIEAGLTPEEWEQVQVVVEIPASIEKTPDRFKLADFLEENTKYAALVKKATRPGKPLTPKFTIRDIDEASE